MTNGGRQSALKLRVGGFHSPRKQLFCSPRRDTAQCSPLSMLATHFPRKQRLMSNDKVSSKQQRRHLQLTQ